MNSLTLRSAKRLQLLLFGFGPRMAGVKSDQLISLKNSDCMEIRCLCLISRRLLFNLSTSYIVFMSRPCDLLLAFGAERRGRDLGPVTSGAAGVGVRVHVCECVCVLEKGGSALSWLISELTKTSYE